MSRLSPRIKAALPVRLDANSANIEMLITDLGVNGAFLRARSSVCDGKLRIDTPVLLQYNVSGKGHFEHRGNIRRKENGGYAVNFCDLDAATKQKLWEFIAGSLSDIKECPFCGQSYNEMPAICKSCGWELNFGSPVYFDYHEKMCILKKLYAKLSAMGMEQLQTIIGFLDAGPVNVTGNEESQEFVGTGKAMLEVFSNIRKVAPTDLSILILGESGTGKELTAQAIHERSPRKDKPFVAINCGAIPDTLLEAELFGFEKGAFTGAHTSKKGKFECADGGTIFLDEIGEMPFSLQVKLLRFLQDKNVERIGAVSGKNVDVRLIAATNRDIGSAIAEGKFRNDLYYRLDEFTIQLPPVRERGDDKIILARFFLKKFSREMGFAKTFTKEAVAAIEGYDWPGNVREIINKVRRAMVMAGGNSVTPADLDLDVPKIGKGAGNIHLNDAVAQIEIEKIKDVLNYCGHNISSAADILGITRQTLHRRIKIYGIKKTP
ncbi:MAG: sigma-54 dependent transcription [Geobacteraceae bacterium]|nr:MAG: sigma-54 dependent transcription [Geobacteraceae bacterium]